MTADAETWLCGRDRTDRFSNNRRTDRRIAGDASQTIWRRKSRRRRQPAARERLWTMHFRTISRNCPCHVRERNFSPPSFFNSKTPSRSSSADDRGRRRSGRCVPFGAMTAHSVRSLGALILPDIPRGGLSTSTSCLRGVPAGLRRIMSERIFENGCRRQSDGRKSSQRD